MTQMTIDPRVLIRDIDGIQSVLLVGKWHPKTDIRKSTYEQLYVWLLANEYITKEQLHSIHNCLYLGVGAKKMVDKYEKERLKKFHKESDVERALSWSDLGSGPMDEICGVKIKGNAVLVFRQDIKDKLGHYCFEYGQRIKKREINKLKGMAAGNSFYLWMKCQEGRDDGVGDLIGTILSEPTFPRDGDTYFVFEKYLIEEMSLPSAAIDRLADAWIEYMDRYPGRIKPGIPCSVCGAFVDIQTLSVVVDNSHSIEYGHEACLSSYYSRCIAKYTGTSVDYDDLRLDLVDYPSSYLDVLVRPLIVGAVIREKPYGLVYFIKSEDSQKIKIGFTSGPIEKRLRSLQTAQSKKLCILASIPGSKDKEAALHQQFASYREGGEWFFPGPELLRYIQEIKCA